MVENEVAVQQGDAGPPARKIPAVAEAFGYAGAALALAALITLVTMFWSDLGVWGRAGISAVVAVAGLGGGFALVRLEEPAAKRLSYFLLFLGVAAIGCAAGFITQYFALQQLAGSMTVRAARDKANEWAWFVGMLGVAVSGGLVWMRHRTWLQHLAFGIGVGMSALLVLPLVPIDGPEWGAGLVLAFVGVIWGAMTMRGWLPPDNAGYLLSSLGILGGIEIMAVSMPPGQTTLVGWAVWLGFGASIALLATGAWRKRLVVVGVAAAGLVLFGVQLLSEVFDIGMGTPIAFLAIGLVLVVGATYATARSVAEERRAGRIVTEIVGYAGAVFLLVGTGTLLGEHWSDLSVATRISVPAVIAAIAYACGLVTDRTDTDSAHRLSQVLLAGGVVAAAATVGLITYEIARSAYGETAFRGENYVPAKDPSNWASFVGALSAVVIGAVTWALRRGAFTEMVTGAACFMAVTTGFGLLSQSPSQVWWPGATVLAIGLAWLVMGLLDRFRPSNVAIGVGCTLAIAGTLMLQEGPRGTTQEWSALLGIGLSVAAIVASLALRRAVLLGFGAAGMVLFSFMTVQLYFEGDIAGPIALLVTGVVLIAMAVLVAVVLPRLRGPSKGGGLKAA